MKTRQSQREQEQIRRYVASVGSRLADLPPKLRERALARLEDQVTHQVKQAGAKDGDGDGAVQRVLDSLGSAAKRASSIRSELASVGKMSLGLPSRRWLGVCSALASRWGVSPWLIRTPFLILGLLSGPFALIVYLAIYFEIHFVGRCAGNPAIDGWMLAKRVASHTFAAVGFYAVGWGGMKIALVAFLRFTKYISIDLGGWQWLVNDGTELLGVVLVLVLPVSVLSALPVAGGWDRTFRKLSQAFLAVYALVVAFGTACFVAGLLVRLVGEYNSGTLTL